MNVGTLLTSYAKRNPERPAVICANRRLSFRELDALTNQIADALIKHGIKVGDRIAVCLPNSIELIGIMGGVLKAGAVVVPISGRLTMAERELIFEDAKPAATFFDQRMRQSVRKANAALANSFLIAVGGSEDGEWDFDRFLSKGSPAPAISLPVEPVDAGITYTSGTTGRPKGVISTHVGIVVAQGYMQAVEFGLRSDDVALITTEIALRTGMGRVSNSFCLGSTMVLMPHFEAKEALNLIEREKVTVIGLVPTIARMLIPEIRRRPEACKTLRVMMATGEAFPVDVMAELVELLPQLGIYSFYAQTEAGIVACLRPAERLTHANSVGRPLPGVEIRIVDADMKDVALGETGEVLVRNGKPGQFSVMRAYYNQPKATAEALVDGWLRTGDMGRLDEDGFLYLVDRLKDMIISGGLNIYSGEVEAALLKHPALAEVAVVGVADAEFGESVVAFVRLKAGQSVAPEILIEHCRPYIAGYKKPKYISFIDELPRNSNGKVMKRELRERAAAEVASLHS